MTYKIIDNFLPPELFVNIQQEMLSANFPWFMNQYLIKPDGNCKIDDRYNWQFTHQFYRDFHICSDQFHLVDFILQKISPSALIRIKANLIPRTEQQIIHEYHLDHDHFDGNVAIFYVNTNDGYTIFKDGTKIDSIENRLLIFDADILHTGTTCTDQKVRCLINFMYYNYTNAEL